MLLRYILPSCMQNTSLLRTFDMLLRYILPSCMQNTSLLRTFDMLLRYILPSCMQNTSLLRTFDMLLRYILPSCMQKTSLFRTYVITIYITQLYAENQLVQDFYVITIYITQLYAENQLAQDLCYYDIYYLVVCRKPACLGLMLLRYILPSCMQEITIYTSLFRTYVITIYITQLYAENQLVQDLCYYDIYYLVVCRKPACLGLMLLRYILPSCMQKTSLLRTYVITIYITQLYAETPACYYDIYYLVVCKTPARTTQLYTSLLRTFDMLLRYILPSCMQKTSLFRTYVITIYITQLYAENQLVQDLCYYDIYYLVVCRKPSLFRTYVITIYITQLYAENQLVQDLCYYDIYYLVVCRKPACLGLMLLRYILPSCMQKTSLFRTYVITIYITQLYAENQLVQDLCYYDIYYLVVCRKPACLGLMLLRYILPSCMQNTSLLGLLICYYDIYYLVVCRKPACLGLICYYDIYYLVVCRKPACLGLMLLRYILPSCMQKTSLFRTYVITIYITQLYAENQLVQDLCYYDIYYLVVCRKPACLGLICYYDIYYLVVCRKPACLGLLICYYDIYYLVVCRKPACLGLMLLRYIYITQLYAENQLVQDLCYYDIYYLVVCKTPACLGLLICLRYILPSCMQNTSLLRTFDMLLRYILPSCMQNTSLLRTFDMLLRYILPSCMQKHQLVQDF